MIRDRQRVLHELRRLLENVTASVMSDGDENTLCHYLQELNRIGLWPLPWNITINEVLQKVDMYQACTRGVQGRCRCLKTELRAMVRRAASLIRSSQLGLGLKYYKKGSFSRFRDNCMASQPALCSRADIHLQST